MKTDFRSWLLCLAMVVASAPAAAQSPGSIESFMNYGTEYLEAGNPASAATYFRLAVAMAPDHAEANYMLAVALQRSGNGTDARRHLDHALALDSSLRGRPESAVFAPAAPPAAKPRQLPAAPAGKPIAATRPVATKQVRARAPTANKAAAKASTKPMSCDEIFGSCSAGATGAAKNMCFVRRNQCEAALEH